MELPPPAASAPPASLPTPTSARKAGRIGNAAAAAKEEMEPLAAPGAVKETAPPASASLTRLAVGMCSGAAMDIEPPPLPGLAARHHSPTRAAAARRGEAAMEPKPLPATSSLLPSPARPAGARRSEAASMKMEAPAGMPSPQLSPVRPAAARTTLEEPPPPASSLAEQPGAEQGNTAAEIEALPALLPLLPLPKTEPTPTAAAARRRDRRRYEQTPVQSSTASSSSSSSSSSSLASAQPPPPHHGEYHVPLDWDAIEERLTLNCVAEREKCRMVMSIFRQDDKPDGGWGSFVWYARKLEENLKYLAEFLPEGEGWLTRLYVDSSVPAEFVRYLMETYNIEVRWVQHLRRGPHRDYLVASIRPLILDDPSITRFICLDCHDELSDVKVRQVLRSRFSVPRAAPYIHWTFWDVDTRMSNKEGAYCYLNGKMYNSTPCEKGEEDYAHRHVDAGFWGFIGRRVLWWGDGTMPAEEIEEDKGRGGEGGGGGGGDLKLKPKKRVRVKAEVKEEVKAEMKVEVKTEETVEETPGLVVAAAAAAAAVEPTVTLAAAAAAESEDIKTYMLPPPPPLLGSSSSSSSASSTSTSTSSTSRSSSSKRSRTKRPLPPSSSAITTSRRSCSSSSASSSSSAVTAERARRAPDGHMLRMLKATTTGYRVVPGHEEAFIDVTIGKLLRAHRPWISKGYAHTGCMRKVEAEEEDVVQWKKRFCVPSGRGAPYRIGLDKSGDGPMWKLREWYPKELKILDLTRLGLPQRPCPLTYAYMEQCWALNLPEAVKERHEERQRLKKVEAEVEEKGEGEEEDGKSEKSDDGMVVEVEGKEGGGEEEGGGESSSNGAVIGKKDGGVDCSVMRDSHGEQKSGKRAKKVEGKVGGSSTCNMDDWMATMGGELLTRDD